MSIFKTMSETFKYPPSLWQMKNKDLYKRVLSSVSDPEHIRDNYKFDKAAMLDIILKRPIDFEQYRKNKSMQYI